MFVELGRAPTADELAARAGVSRPEVVALWRGLHDAHALVLDPSGELRMANLKVRRTKGENVQTDDIHLVLENGEWKMTP